MLSEDLGSWESVVLIISRWGKVRFCFVCKRWERCEPAVLTEGGGGESLLWLQ